MVPLVILRGYFLGILHKMPNKRHFFWGGGAYLKAILGASNPLEVRWDIGIIPRVWRKEENRILIHLGSKYGPFEYHLDFKWFGFQMVGLWALCTGPTNWIPDQHIRKQDGIYLQTWAYLYGNTPIFVYLTSIQMVRWSGFQFAFEYRTIWHPTSFWPFEYQNSLYSDPTCTSPEAVSSVFT